MIGMVGLGAAMIGYFLAPANPLIRLMSFVGGITLIYPGLMTDILGFGLLGAVVFLQLAKSKRLKSAA